MGSKPNHLFRSLLCKRYKAGFSVLFISAFILFYSITPPVSQALSNYSPFSPDNGFHNLVYGGSTTTDVQIAVGEPPDEIIRSEQMYPVVENYYYYDQSGSGAASVFVFENGLLVGFHLKTSDNQYVDLTYFLQDNGDRALNSNLRAGYRGYYPYFPFVTPF